MIDPTIRQVILGSQSPRRRELLDLIDVPYSVEVRSVDEVFPDDMPVSEVAEYLAKLKATAFDGEISIDEVLITADSIVVVDDQIYGKASSRSAAIKMIGDLSGRVHSVYTGVCLTSADKQISFTDEAIVHFDTLTPTEIAYYVDKYQPYDKAGAYGIQEWIGYAKIIKIQGTFATIMGLPVQQVYRTLIDHFSVS